MNWHKNRRRRLLGRRLAWSHADWALEQRMVRERRWEGILAFGGAVCWLVLIYLIGGALWRS
jgi:hypothetical protein